ncbi:MAG: FAD-binding oxidoreductase [Deltaproteobacteria bacterium]|nr:FAD-binding oxidoreductase [Deltaproteobacteria bacterium]
MKSTVDQLAQRLGVELGAAAVITEQSVLASHIVDGMQPALVCFPAAAEQIAAALRVAAEAEAAVIPWGGGTAMQIGNRPRSLDVVMETGRLDRVIEHDGANLTATVQSGMTLMALQEVLARQKQILPFDPPFPARATIGGIVAANLNGPRRSCYGSVRDLVIGMKVSLASGEVIKAGGKVVKNVAGYDMCKLFVGSLGTLGILTEVTLRVAPIPETAATVVAAGALPKVLRFVDELSRSPLLPAAVALMNSRALGAGQNDWRAAIRCEGFAETVARHTNDALAMAQRVGLGAEILRDSADGQLWDRVRDFPLQTGRVVYRVTVARASVAESVRAIREWNGSEFQPAILSNPPTGTLWVAESERQTSPQRFADLLSLAPRCGGHAIIFAAPDDTKKNIDVWGPPPPTLALMREMKNQFDPTGLLNPGRFVGGL